MMFTRSRHALVCAALAGCLAAGCGGLGDSTAALQRDDTEAEDLSPVGEAALVLSPGASVELAVLYSGAAGSSVEFAVLAGEVDAARPSSEAEFVLPPGASLEPANAQVDGSGLARTWLTVGSSPGTFRVRARAAGAAPVFFDIEVSAAQAPSLTVYVRYEGLREVASRSATVVPSVSCAEALMSDKAPFVVRTVMDAAKGLLFDELVPKVGYAVLAWGRDASGAAQAYGCAEHTASLTDDKDSAAKVLYVDIEDRPLRFGGYNYPLELSFEFGASMARLAATAEGAAPGLLPESEKPEATFYLDAIYETLSALKPSEAAIFQMRRNAVLDALDGALLAKSVGLTQAGSALAASLASAGKTLSVRAALGVGATNVPMTLAITSMVARSDAEGTLSLDLMGYPSKLAPSAQILAEYDDARAQVNVRNLGISLGLGSYGAALLDALAERDGSTWYVPKFGSAAGCDVLSAFVASEAELQEAGQPLCDADCAKAVCEQVLGQLVARVQQSFPALDVEHATVSLMGQLGAHDRQGDESIDDLGPSPLTGNWGTASGASAEDAVSASVVSMLGENALTL